MSSIDLDKRNAVIRKYAPELFERRTKPRSPISLDYDALLAASGRKSLDLMPFFLNPGRFEGKSDAEIAAMLVREMDASTRGDSLSIAEFFDGNTQPQSIAPNLGNRHPGLRAFHRTLEDARAQRGIIDVRISVHEWPNPRSRRDDEQWIAGESVFVWARGWTAAALEALLAPLLISGVGPVSDPDQVPLGGPGDLDRLEVFVATWD